MLSLSYYVIIFEPCASLSWANIDHMCIVLRRLSLTLVIRNITSPNSPGRIHTRACRCSWRPPTGSGSVRSGTYLHESTPLWPRTWAWLSRAPWKAAKRNNVPAETRSSAGTASTTCRPPNSRQSPASTRLQSSGDGSELSLIGRCVLRRRAGEHAGPVRMWKEVQVSRSTFNKQREIKASQHGAAGITVPDWPRSKSQLGYSYDQLN